MLHRVIIEVSKAVHPSITSVLYCLWGALGWGETTRDASSAMFVICQWYLNREVGMATADLQAGRTENQEQWVEL